MDALLVSGADPHAENDVRESSFFVPLWESRTFSICAQPCPRVIRRREERPCMRQRPLQTQSGLLSFWSRLAPM